MTIGARKPSQITGYDTLPITLSRGANTQVIDFLISTDGKTLARLETFDLVKDPVSSIDVPAARSAAIPPPRSPSSTSTISSAPTARACTRRSFPATLERYKDMVRFIYKDNPLAEIHPWAMHAAVDANCLAAQSGDVYWTYVDYIHAHGEEVSGEDRNQPKSFDALNRIARQEATLAKLDDEQAGRLPRQAGRDAGARLG